MLFFFWRDKCTMSDVYGIDMLQLHEGGLESESSTVEIAPELVKKYRPP